MSAPATVYIIKVGGNVIDNPAFLDGFLKDFAAVPALKVLIHGGGKIATRIGDKLGIAANYVNGGRVVFFPAEARRGDQFF